MTEDITPEGYKKIEDEIKQLDTVERKKVSARLEQALGFGDLSENAAYDEAKEAYGMLEGRLRELKRRLASVRVIDTNKKDGVVRLGSTVVVDMAGDAITYKIASPEDADPLQGKVSAQSPIGEALMGKKVNAKVTVDLPAGTQQLTIKKVD